MNEKATEGAWPTLRVAGKDGEFHILWPGDLSTPFKRSGFEVRTYRPDSISTELAKALETIENVGNRRAVLTAEKALIHYRKQVNE